MGKEMQNCYRPVGATANPAHLVESLRVRVDHSRRDTAPELIDLMAVDTLRPSY